MTTEQIAIIDLGTNTFHLLLAEVNEHDQISIKGKFKEPVKLGEGGINSGFLTEFAFKRGIRALQNFRKLIDSAGVSQVFAYATSAIRSASNGKEFLREASSKANITIRVINGNEEAALIHEGVKNGVRLPQNQANLLLDIGGGSVEFIVSENGEPLLLRSLNIGAARLMEAINPSDPMKEKEMKKLEVLLHKELGSLVKELREFNLQLLVGSSGTFETLATLIAYQKKDRLSASNLNGYKFSRGEFNSIFAKLINTTRAKRLKMQGMDSIRVDMILMGGAICSYLFAELNLDQCMVSDFALKEGMLYRFIRNRHSRVKQFLGEADRNLRAKAVQNLAKHYEFDPRHGLKVSELSSSLFDQLAGMHQLGADEKEILQYAAILHDIGKFINPSAHHKHGQYIIMNSNLSGFSTNELVLLANVVRYHRKSMPKRDHFHYNILSDERKRIVSILAGILRIADNLDRGHRNLVKGVKLDLSLANIIHLTVQSAEDVEMEVDAARAMRDLLEIALNRTIRIEQEAGKRYAERLG
ncbi:MAG: Ppx/GppA phosphatase family protein [Bacteroidota bacterium]